MRHLTQSEVQNVGGGISGYEGSGAVLTVLGVGLALGPIGVPVVGIALGAAGGLALAQLLADLNKKTE